MVEVVALHLHEAFLGLRARRLVGSNELEVLQRDVAGDWASGPFTEVVERIVDLVLSGGVDRNSRVGVIPILANKVECYTPSSARSRKSGALGRPAVDFELRH